MNLGPVSDLEFEGWTIPQNPNPAWWNSEIWGIGAESGYLGVLFSPLPTHSRARFDRWARVLICQSTDVTMK